jgi:hypothetical protein
MAYDCMVVLHMQDLSLAHVIRGDFYLFLEYFIQHCFIRRPSNYTVSEDAGILLRIVATLELVVRALTTRLYFIHTRLDLIHTRLDLIYTRLDLIHTRLDLIHTRLDLIHTLIDLLNLLSLF